MNNLLSELAGAVKAFYADLNDDGWDQKVLTMTYSEFGRRIEQNGSVGTDHGTAAPQLLIGKGTLNGGIIGNDPDLDSPDNRGNLVPTTDFRSFYGSVLTEWFGVDCNQAFATLDHDYDNLNFVTNPEVSPATCTLPIELATFDAIELEEGQVQLNWATSSELNNAGFEIERLFMNGNREKWTNLGFVDGAGTTSSSQEYSFVDTVSEAGTYRYRLKQIDFNGASSYSNRVELFVEVPDNLGVLQIYPNPTSADVNFKLKMTSKAELDVRIYDNNGRVVRNLGRVSHRPNSISEIRFSVEDLATGKYILTAEGEDVLHSKLLIIAR